LVVFYNQLDGGGVIVVVVVIVVVDVVAVVDVVTVVVVVAVVVAVVVGCVSVGCVSVDLPVPDNNIAIKIPNPATEKKVKRLMYMSIQVQNILFHFTDKEALLY
jgi:archaellum biogenesis protein FlaJ (TadC family)